MHISSECQIIAAWYETTLVLLRRVLPLKKSFKQIKKIKGIPETLWWKQKQIQITNFYQVFKTPATQGESECLIPNWGVQFIEALTYLISPNLLPEAGDD